MVKIPCSQFRDIGSIPGLVTEIPRAVEHGKKKTSCRPEVSHPLWELLVPGVVAAILFRF